jgi:tetratricopeptide (TPR) repeat protein
MTVNPNPPDPAQAEFEAAKVAFERGSYRDSVNKLEQALALVNPNSSLGGDVQIWLVTAYEAAEQRQEAIDLCKQLTRHPDLKTRKEGRRLLYILEAPKLKSRPEWLTQIPDLATLADSDAKSRYASAGTPSKPRSRTAKPKIQFEPVDLSSVNTEDNRFVWVALLAALLVIGSLLWLG